MTEGQLLFEFVEEHPEVVEQMLRDVLQEEVRRYVQKEIRLVHEDLPFAVERHTKLHLREHTKEAARSIFNRMFTDPDEPGELQIKRYATAEMLNCRKTVMNVYLDLQRKLEWLEHQFELWTRGRDVPGREPPE